MRQLAPLLPIAKNERMTELFETDVRKSNPNPDVSQYETEMELNKRRFCIIQTIEAARTGKFEMKDFKGFYDILYGILNA